MKKAIALLCTLILLLSLAACSTASEKTPSADSGSKQVSGTPFDAPGGDTTEVPVGTADKEVKTLKIGALACETGFMAVYDLNNVYELKCMIELLNEAGGITIGDDTYMLDVVVADGQSDTEGMRSAAMLLVEENVDFVIETNDFLIVSAQDIFEKAELLHISSYNSLDPDAMGE